MNAFCTSLGTTTPSDISSSLTRLLQSYIEVNAQTVSPSSEYVLDEWATKGDIERYRETALENNTSVTLSSLPSKLTNRITFVTQALSSIYTKICSLSPDAAVAALPALLAHTPTSLTQPYEDTILQLNAQIITLKSALNYSTRELHQIQ